MTDVPAPLFFLENQPDVLAAFSTRVGGKSRPPFQELNLGLHVDDKLETVLTNRQLLCTHLGLTAKSLTAGQQVHNVTIQVVTTADQGRGATEWSTAFPETDGLVTAIPNVPLMVVVADCAAVYVYDPTHHVIGLGHAGWRGTLKGLPFALLNTMNDQFGTVTSDVQIAIGPCIGGECYEVGEEIRTAFREQWGQVADSFFTATENGRLQFDLRQALKWQLTQLGVPTHHLEISPDCTSCQLDRFFSHRAEHGQTGRMAAVLMLRPQST